MRSQARGAGSGRDRSFWVRLVLLALFFIAGVILGRLLAVRTPESTARELNRYLKDYFSISDTLELSSQAAVSSLVIYFRYPMLAFLLGFASVGVALLPILSAAYGFFLSFSVCCLTAAFGGDGVLLALAVFGMRCLVTLPCFFSLAVPSFQNAFLLCAMSFGSGKRQAAVHYGKDWWVRLCAVSALLLAAVAAETLISPFFLHLALENILF